MASVLSAGGATGAGRSVEAALPAAPLMNSFGLLKGIDICTDLTHPTDVKRSGVYPIQ